MDIKAGWKTSEFWITQLPTLGTILSIVLGASNPVTLGFMAAAALATSIYTASRAHVKATGLQAAVAAAKAAAGAINGLPK